MTPFDFVTRQDYAESHKREIIEVLAQLFKCLIGEEDDISISGWNSVLDNKNKSRQDTTDQLSEKPPFVIVIDNAHNMCPTSWDLLEAITEECYRIVIILLMQSDDMDRIRIHPDSVKTFERVYNSIQDQIDIIKKDLPRLTKEDLAQILI